TIVQSCGWLDSRLPLSADDRKRDDARDDHAHPCHDHASASASASAHDVRETPPVPPHSPRRRSRRGHACGRRRRHRLP
ncbi:hypothetical protein ABTD78_24925, partial [Acinetobacter baumannii]